MECSYLEWRDAWKPQGTWTWGMLASLVLHGLLVAGIVVAYQDRPPRPKVVVPVEAICLVAPGPKGGGGGQPAPVTRPQPVAQKPKPKVSPRPKRRVKPKPRPRPVPLPEPTKAPVIPTPAPAPAASQAKPSITASAGSRTCPPGAVGGGTGTGRGGRGGGSGTGSGRGVGPGQGRGLGSGSALQGYLRTVRQILEKRKDYPWMARRRNMQGVVIVMFTIASGGQIESARVSRSSGHDLLDEGARNTIKRVGRFPPFPAELNRRKLTIKIPLAFRLTRN
jgi:periplasmic protein TonB